MSAAGRPRFGAAIAAQEQRVRSMDQRLRDTLGAARRRLTRSRTRNSGAVWGIGSVAAAWFLVRRRHFLATPARAQDRVTLLVDAALPLLTPAIGVRAAALLSVLASPPSSPFQPAPAVAPRIDLNLYAGTWYEVGRLPKRRERICAADVTATYLPEGNGVRVVNRCRRGNGRLEAVTGRARVVDRATRAKLKITFAPKFLRWVPGAWADYWILDVTPDYRRALVGTPDRKALWLLAREPYIAEAEFRAMLLLAAAQGYDTQRVRLTAQRPAQ